MQNFATVINATAAVLMTVLPPAFWDEIKSAKSDALKSYAQAQIQAQKMVETGDFSAMNGIEGAIAQHQQEIEAALPLAEMLIQKGYLEAIPEIK